MGKELAYRIICTEPTQLFGKKKVSEKNEIFKRPYECSDYSSAFADSRTVVYYAWGAETLWSLEGNRRRGRKTDGVSITGIVPFLE